MLDYKTVLKHYQEHDGIKDENMLDEAIETLEDVLNQLSFDRLIHHSRPLAIAYLALKIEKQKWADDNWEQMGR